MVERGAPALVEVLDKGEISVSAASAVAGEEPDRQQEILASPKEIRRELIKALRDATGLPSPSEARRIARETGKATLDYKGSTARAEWRCLRLAALDLPSASAASPVKARNCEVIGEILDGGHDK